MITWKDYSLLWILPSTLPLNTPLSSGAGATEPHTGVSSCPGSFPSNPAPRLTGKLERTAQVLGLLHQLAIAGVSQWTGNLSLLLSVTLPFQSITISKLKKNPMSSIFLYGEGKKGEWKTMKHSKVIQFHILQSYQTHTEVCELLVKYFFKSCKFNVDTETGIQSLCASLLPADASGKAAEFGLSTWAPVTHRAYTWPRPCRCRHWGREPGDARAPPFFACAILLFKWVNKLLVINL